ncbi:hypothetical protein ACS0TY_026443 [Phlomoides rotata]
MEKTTLLTSLLQAKLLCFSLIYLLSAVYLSLPSTKCSFRSTSGDALFSYPSSYGEHKYAISTTRSSCNSPVFFSDYSIVLKKMQNMMKNSTPVASLRYMQGNAQIFGGNFSFEKRMSYFDETETEIPCGFMQRFPISNSDQISMEKCDGLVVVSAIFNDHDKIRQPKNIGSRTLDHVSFFMFVDHATLKTLRSHNLISTKESEETKIGAWRIVKVLSGSLYENAAMNGVIPKHLVHRLFPNAKYSIWVDAKLQLMIDPLLLLDSLIVKRNVDMALSKHPYFVHTMEEAIATARWKKWWDVNGLKVQMETYCEHGLEPWNSNKPYPTDVPDSALILRKHSASTNLFSCLLFNELEAFNPRDQLPFAFVRDKINQRLKINMFEVEVFEQVVLEYRHNLKQGGAQVGPELKWASSDLFGNEENCSKCEGYFMKMWGNHMIDSFLCNRYGRF